MEHYSDSPFRQIVRKASPETVVYTEFISVDGLKYNPKKVSKKYSYDPIENPLIVQLFGGDPDHFVNAVKMLEEVDIAGIDINMGCPAHRVVKCQYGAALIQDAPQAWKIAEACVKATDRPVTVKTRLGWAKNDEVIEFSKGFEQVGVKAIAIHGRTYKQGFSGEADWEPMYKTKEALSEMKVIGNGDINCGQFAIDKIGNLDGVMVGHHTFGNPWLLEEVHRSLKTGKEVQIRPSFIEKIPWILEHCDLQVDYKGEEIGVREIRKQLGEYTKGFDGARELRSRLVRVDTLAQIKEILQEAQETLSCLQIEPSDS
jgi:nifR3 family TIM-barrel protein